MFIIQILQFVDLWLYKLYSFSISFFTSVPSFFSTCFLSCTFSISLFSFFVPPFSFPLYFFPALSFPLFFISPSHTFPLSFSFPISFAFLLPFPFFPHSFLSSVFFNFYSHFCFLSFFYPLSFAFILFLVPNLSFP